MALPRDPHVTTKAVVPRDDTNYILAIKAVFLLRIFLVGCLLVDDRLFFRCLSRVEQYLAL